jgi:hypothetical protein
MLKFAIAGKLVQINWLHVSQLALGAAIVGLTWGENIHAIPANLLPLAAAALTLFGLLYKDIFHVDPPTTPPATTSRTADTLPPSKPPVPSDTHTMRVGFVPKVWVNVISGALMLYLVACAALAKVAPSGLQLIACVVDDAIKGDTMAQIATDCSTDIPNVIGSLTSKDAAKRNPNVSSTPAYAEMMKAKAALASFPPAE